MKKIIRQYLKQIVILLVLVGISFTLNSIFTKSSIRGDYETVTIGITKGADRRIIKKEIEEALLKEFEEKKKVEIEAVGSFGTEFRLKSDSINDEERRVISDILIEKYEDISVSSVSKNPEANYESDFMMHLIYILIIVVFGIGAVFLLSQLNVEADE